MILQDKYTIIAQSPKDYYEKDTSDLEARWYIPGRMIPLAFPESTTIILPGDNPEIRDFIRLCEKVLFDGRKINVLWTSGKSFTLDEDIAEELLSEVQEHVYKYSPIIFPYSSVMPHFLKWAQKLKGNFQVFGNGALFHLKYGTKSILHRRIDSLEIPSFVEREKVQVPQGFVCKNNEELLKAYDLLGNGKAILKPVRGGGGLGIIPINSHKELEDYSFDFGEVILEEMLGIDFDPKRELKVICNYHFINDKIFGQVANEINGNRKWQGSYCPAFAKKEIVNQVLQEAKKFHTFLIRNGLCGPGGFDIAVAQERPYIIDVNMGRITGAHPLKLFQYYFAPTACWVSKKIKPSNGITLKTFWRFLVSQNLAFNKETQRGIFPLFFISDWTMLMSFFPSIDEAEKNLRTAENFFVKHSLG